MYAVDVASGKVVWDLPNEFKQRCVGSPVVVGDLIVAGDGSGGKGTHIVAVKPPKKPTEKAAVVWQSLAGLPYVTCMLAKEELLFFVNDAGSAVCMDGATGKEIWRESLGVGTFYGSPILVGDRLYVVSKRGEVVTLSATKEFKILGISQLGDGSFSTPAIGHGRMYLRTFTTVVAVGAK
jgi:outer membrane protein assembly factor BamB